MLILARVWRSPGPFDPHRGYSWLRKRLELNNGFGGREAPNLRAALRNRRDALSAIADHFLTSIPIDGSQWPSYYRFREATLLELSSETLFDHVVDQLYLTTDDQRREFLYELGLTLCCQSQKLAQRRDVVERLYALADSRTSLRPVRESTLVTKLPANYFQGRSSRAVDTKNSRERQRRQFDEKTQQIRNGIHSGWMQHLGRIYFALFSDVNREATPRERLAEWLGEDRVDVPPSSRASENS
jgi:hypothetical protein